MEELDASDGNVAEALAKEFAKEKNDIVCGFLKEKEIIEMMHKEEVNDLVEKFEHEKEYIRKEFELEKEDLLQRFQAQQVEKINEFQRERENMETKQTKDCESAERTLEMKYKGEKLEMRRQYENVIAEKNEEINMLRRELLRVQYQGGNLSRTSPDNDIYIKRTEHEDELRRIRNDFEIEKLELERKCDREKAELVQVFANQAERMNANFDQEKQRIEQDHQKELDFKLEVTEKMLSEKADIERKRMIQRFEGEIMELHESSEIGFKERLLEKQEVIDNLEKEKKEILNALQNERFSLAHLYNREVSLLTNPDQVTKEDVEVALIDEIAKLKKEHDDALTEMEGQHKQKIEVIKRGQQPTKELERKHRKEIEKLKKELEKEKESLETEFRNEQFNLLKSFEFEKNDLEQRYEEIINEKELEIQQREDDMRRMYEGDIEELKSIVEKQRGELEVSKQKLGDLASEMEEFVSEKNRIEEKFHKENNQCQNLEQTIEKNLRAFEKNLKEAEALHQNEMDKTVEDFTRERKQLTEQLKNEKLDLQREIETLKGRLDEFQMASENAIVSSSENVLESDLVVNNAADEKCGNITAGEESKAVGNKSPSEEMKGETGPLDKKEWGKDPLEGSEGEDKQGSRGSTKQDSNEFLGKIKEELKKCISDEGKKDTLEDLQMSNKQMKDTVNQVIKEIDALCGSKAEHDVVSLEDEPTFSLEDQLLALENILKESYSDGESEKSRKDHVNEKVKDILKDAHRCHEVEKLKLNKEHQEEINNMMKEVADEKRARVQNSLETLKRLQELDQSGDHSLNFVALKITEEKSTSTDDIDNREDASSLERTKRGGKENVKHTPSDIAEELRREKEEMKRSIDELEKSFTKEKEDLIEKLQTQHREFVMSTEGEIIENLLKQKSTLEEAFNLERFYLSRLYYLEMKDELEDILSRKTEKMKRDFDRDKMDIILKYESEIADLHNLLSEKGDMELRLLQDRNDTMQKLLATQKRKGPEKGKSKVRQNEKEQLEREKENLAVTIPLKKEIAELQNKRHQEHEMAVANLKEAIHVIKDIMSNPPSRHQEDDKEIEQYSFVSEDPVRSAVTSPQAKRSEKNLKPGKRLLLSEDEIRSKEELKSALENLVEIVLNDDEDSVYDSEITSGASSDLESEESGPTTINGESDEGAYSGPESTDGDMLQIKKAELDFTFHLERFNLGRVYYGEYRDSLKKAMKKLAKAKDSLRNKRKDLENELLIEIKKLVDRTQFGGESAQAPNAGEEAVITDHEDRPKDDVDGQKPTESEGEDNKTTSAGGDDVVVEDSHGYIESDPEKEKGVHFQDTNTEYRDVDHSLYRDNVPEDGIAEIEGKPQQKLALDGKEDQDRPSENDIESANTVDQSETEPIKQIGEGITEEKQQDPGGLENESGLLEDKADDESAIEQRDNSSLSEREGRQDSAEKTIQDASFEKPHRKDDSVTREERAAASPEKKDKKEDANVEQNTQDKNVDQDPEAKNGSFENGEPKVRLSNSSDEKPLILSTERASKYSGETFSSSNDTQEGDVKGQDTAEDNLKETDDVDNTHGLNSEAGIKGKDLAFEKPVIQKSESSTGDKRETSQGNKDLKRAGDYEEVPGDDSLTKEGSVTEVEAGKGKEGLDSNKTEYEDKQKENQPLKEEIEAQKLMDEKNRFSSDQEGKNRESQKDEKPEDCTESTVKQEDEPITMYRNEPMDRSPKEDEILKSGVKEDDFKKPGDKGFSVSEEYIPEYDRLSDNSDALFQAIDKDNRDPSYQESSSPVNDQDLIKQLNRNNKALQDKFNLLCELVGKAFVNEIPELRDEKEKEGHLVALEGLNDLCAEREHLTDELQLVESKIKELTATGNDNLRDLNKRLDEEEVQLLRSLGEIDKQLKSNDDKELVEHLLKEKENVCTKLDEINNLLSEQKQGMIELGSQNPHTVPGLMCKKDVLKDDLCEKERQLSYKTKMLEAGTNSAAKEKENLRNTLNSLNAQLAALEDGIQESDANAYPYGRKQGNKELPTEVASLVKSKADAENDKAKLETEITKTENDIGRYSRILEEQRRRLQPFLRKRGRIVESLDWFNSTESSEGETSRQSEDNDVEEPVENETEAPLAEKTKYLDRDEAAGEIHGDIENRVETLELEISKLELPCELKQEIIGKSTIADKKGILNRVKLRTEEELKCLEDKLVVEQNKLKEAGLNDLIEVAQHLEEKEYLTKEIAKLENYQSTVDDSTEDANLSLIKQLKKLLLQKEDLKEKVRELTGEISNEQHNFLDARQFKSTGNVNEESGSNIKGLIDNKAKLVASLKDTNDTILESLSTGGLKGPQTEFIEECVERKVKLEDEIDRLQEKIDEETLRAVEMLADHLQQKSLISEELQNTSERAAEEAKMLQENVSYDYNVTEEINELISEALLEAGTTAAVIQERKQLQQKQREMEDSVKEIAERLREVKRLKEYPDEVEGALEKIIREKIPVDKRLQESDSKGFTLQLTSASTQHKERPAESRKLDSESDNEKDNINAAIKENASLHRSSHDANADEKYESEVSLTLGTKHKKGEADTAAGHSDENFDEKRRELGERLNQVENHLCNMLQIPGPSGSSSRLERDDLEELSSLVVKKIKVAEVLQKIKLLEDLLNKKETSLQEQLCNKDEGEEGFERKTQLESEQKKMNKVIDRRESEMREMEAKKEEKEKALNQLNIKKENLLEKLEPLKENMHIVKEDIEAALDDLQANITEHEKRSGDEEQALQKDLQNLQNEIEFCNREVKEVEKELNRLTKESRQRRDTIPGAVLSLEKLLIEKENLREYLAEIDTTLDNSQTDANEQTNPAKMEELRKQKREFKNKLEEIRDEKAKLDVEFEDDEMDEVVKELSQRKNELEERKREVIDEIRSSGVMGKLAEKRRKRESKMPRYYIQGILDEMSRDEKTLTELIKEQEDLKVAAQRQSERLEDEIDLLKSKIGEDLVNAVTLDPEDTQVDRGNEYRAGIDEVQGNEATISDILSDLSAENKEVRELNSELSTNLETLKEKIGEDLVPALLGNSLPHKDPYFGDVISAVQGEEETLASILRKQKVEKDLISDLLGKDLSNSILKTEDTVDPGLYTDSTPKILAPTIMKKYDEDLENVIAVYEKELDNLSRENDFLKEKLGKDLSLALLQIGKRPETPVSIARKEKDIPLISEDEKTDVDETQVEGRPTSLTIQHDSRSAPSGEGRTLLGKEGLHSDDDILIVDAGSDARGKAKESVKSVVAPKSEMAEAKEPEKELDIQSSKEQPALEDMDHLNDRGTLPEQESIKPHNIEPRLYNIVASHFGSPVERSPAEFIDEDIETVEGTLNAPKIMKDNDYTLEEVIAEYENELGTRASKALKRKTALSGYSPKRADRVENPEDICKVEETMQGIVDTQAKNMEMLRVLKDRLGEDLVNALINETEKDQLDGLMNDVKQSKAEDLVESKDDDEMKFEERSLAGQENVPAEEQTSTEVEEMIDSSVGILPREKPKISVDGKEDAVKTCEEDQINKRTLKAPSIALEKNTTLADVIESYEVGLDSLRSKLGPSLTNSLLSMEDQTTAERQDDNKGIRRTPTKELKGVPSKEAQQKTDDGGKDGEEKNRNVTPTQEEKPGEVISTKEETFPVKELRAPDIMATSGKTLEEVIEDYEERLSEELNSLEKEVSLLKEKLGNDLFQSLLAHPSSDEETPPAEEIKYQEYSKETDEESLAILDDASLVPDLKAKSLLQDEGKTLEDILRKYERQLEKLAKLVPNDSSEEVSILDLTSNYEDKIADLEKENKTFEDRLAKLADIIGPDLLQKLENMDDEKISQTEEAVDSVGEDGIKAPIAMQKDDKSLENVLRDYEKELALLRKLLPNQSEEDISIADIIKDYEEKMEDLGKRNTSLKGEHDRLVSDIGSNLVDDILKLTLVDNGSDGDAINSSDSNLLTQPETLGFNVESGLNAPEFMRRDGSTLEDVLEIYEKALGLLPRPPGPREDSFVDSKMHTFEDLKRENKILRDTLGDSLAENLLEIVEKTTPPISGALKKSTKTGEFNAQSEKNTEIATDTSENVKQSSERGREEGMSVYSEENKLEAVKLVRDEGRTIKNILKNYEKELEALRNLVPCETGEGVSVSELVKDYEDKIEKMDTENTTLLDMLDDLKKNIGPALMNELQNLDNKSMEYNGNHLDGMKPSGLQAPLLMENESKTLEGVVKSYENELDALRKLIPDEGNEATSISDIIKDYEDKVEELSKDNKTLKDELHQLEEKIGDDLVNDLQNVAVKKFEETEITFEAGETCDSSVLKTKRTVKAPGIMNETKLPLEDIVATYEQDLYNLERENKVYKDGLGKGLADALLKFAQNRDNNSSEKCETQDVESTLKSNERIPDKPADLNKDKVAAIRGTYSEYMNPPSQNEVDDEATDDLGTGNDELNATALLKEGGNDLQKILKKYEKELEALRKLTPRETEAGISISDLITNYENKIDTLENENKFLAHKLHNLRETIGQDLYGALDNLKSEDIVHDGTGDKQIDVDAINVMKNEDRTLENVVKNYEKELIALRKLVPEREGESGSVSDVIKEYEDKFEELQRQKEDLANTLDQPEGKIESNLFRDLTDAHIEGEEVGSLSDDDSLQEKVKEIKVKGGAPGVKIGKELTLECLVASQEKDINDLTKENKALKEILGQTLSETLVNIAGEKGMSPLTDSDDQGQEAKRPVSEEPTTSSSPKKGKGSRKKRVGKGSMEDLAKVYAQPTAKNNNDKKEVSTTSPAGNLKAEALVRDEGRTIEDILNNYEKELEALTKLVPDNDGISISQLVTEYEDKIKILEKENDGLFNRLEDFKQKIGSKLFSAVENGEQEADLGLLSDSEQRDENRLMAPGIMQTEGRSLENVLNTYEKELDTLRSLIPSEGKDGQSISDMVKAYEDKLEQLRAENESLRKDSDKLVKRIGPNLVDEIQKLEEIGSDVTEGVDQSEVDPDLERNKPVKDLKVTKIMDVKQSTLEEVLETYENALGVFLSDSPTSMEELSSENFIEDHTSTMEELRQENDILKNNVGVSLSQRLLNIAKDDKDTPEQSFPDSQEIVQRPEEETGPDFDDDFVTKASKHPPQKGSLKDPMKKSLSPSEELKAESLIKEEGRTIENILKNYEKELEALKSLVSKDSGQPVDAISNLVTKYEEEMDHLKNEKDNLSHRIEFLERKIGPDLMNDLENQKYLPTKGSEETLEGTRKSELNAPVIVEEENRTLQAVINCYEKELDALRKLAPKHEKGQSVSISDIFKDYEDSLHELKKENNSLKSQYGMLADRLGSNLVNDIRKLNEEESKEKASAQAENERGITKAAQSEKPLKAPQIMHKNNSTLENVLERYEDSLGLHLDSANKDSDQVVTDDELRGFGELQDENNILKKTLGENWAQEILKMEKAKELKGDLECDNSLQGEAENDLTKLTQEGSSLDIKSKDRKSFEVDASSSSDELKANALIKDKGSTVENILKNYEKEIEALSKLVPNEADSGYSISDLVKEYEEKIEGLNTENCNLEHRLESLTKKIGQDLVNDLESPVLEQERDSDELEAPLVMQKEGKTLEKIVRNYEKELEALRKTVSYKGENPNTITSIVNECQGKIEELKTDNESLKEKFGCLKQRIGSNLLEDIMSIKSEVTEGDLKKDAGRETRSEQANLKTPKIMQEKKLTLEDVLESYETALSSGPGNEMMSKVHGSLDDKTIHNLEIENKLFRDSLGDSLAQKLLEFSKMKDLVDAQQSDDKKSPTSGLSRGTSATASTENNGQSPTEALPSDLKATKLITDKGQTIENVLRRYERDLEALGGPDHKDAVTLSSNIAGYEEIELLKEKVGLDLINELLLLSKSDARSKQSWKALETMREEEKTLEDILETYERELERLKRERSAIEALLNDDESDGQSALDIISQYEDEIEHLKDKNKELETKLSFLFAKMGDNLVNDVLGINDNQASPPRSSLNALEIMEKQEKQLSAILEQYESDISKLTRENEMLNAIASKERVDGRPLTNVVSEYEGRIQELLDEKHQIERNLMLLSEKVGDSLANELLNPGENEQTSSLLDAVKIMENERKTLSEVTKEYENELARNKREISALQELVSEDSEKSSFMDRISKYEDEIYNLNEKIQELALLEKKVGMDLSRQLTALANNESEWQQTSTFKAVEIMKKEKDKTLADAINDYEEELEKKEHEILTLKELVSGDILEIATSQESEIDELKKVKEILANEIDLISNKVGQDLTDKIMKRSSLQPEAGIAMFYHKIVERMEVEDKPLADILQDYEKEVKLLHSKNKELSHKKDTLTNMSEKIGRDLLDELLKEDLSDSSATWVKPLFQAPQVMSVEEKTLGEVIIDYENEMENLKREKEALRMLTEGGSSQDNSVLDVLSNYEEKIGKINEDNRELNKKLQNLTQRVGMELTEELLKLPDDVDKFSAGHLKGLQALKTLEENQTTLAHVLQDYEKRLKEREEADLGPLVSGEPITEDVKYANLVHVTEGESKIAISEEEPLVNSRYLLKDGTDEMKTIGKRDLYQPADFKETSLEDQDPMKKISDVNAALHNKLEQLSRKVGRELAEELMRSPEDENKEIKSAVTFASVRDLEAYADLVAERATVAQVLESYEKKLKGTLKDEKSDFSGPLVEGRVGKDDIRCAQLLRASEYEPTASTMPSNQLFVEEEICDFNEADVVNHNKLSNVDSNLVQNEEKMAASDKNVGVNEIDDHVNLAGVDLKAVGDLILKEPQIFEHPEESLLLCQDRQIVQEDIIKVERPVRYEEHFNSEYMDDLFGSEVPAVETVTDSRWAERYLNEKLPETSEHDKYELEGLKNKVNELENELEEERNLKEKYEKDVQDLLQDIVDLKIKQAGDDEDETPEETRQRIQEEIELKQENKRLQDEIRKEKKRRLSIEESKRDLLDEVDSLMREKEALLKQHNGAKDSEKLLEDMINLRKKLGELDTENKHLHKEVKELKEALSEVVVNHDDEKNKLLADCEIEKSEMMEELVASKIELENQLQELLGMNDDLKGTIKNLQEELKESSEKLSTEEEVQSKNEPADAEINNNDEENVTLLQKLEQLELDANEFERKLLYEKDKNEKLKEQLDETENALRQTLTKYQDEIKSIETEKGKQKDQLRKEIEILTNKVQLEKASAEQQQRDFENVVQKEKERLKEDIETEHEREKRKLQNNYEDKKDELSRQEKRRLVQLQDQEEHWKKEREELQAMFRAEKEKLEKAFDEELNRKILENDEQHQQRTEEISRMFAKEKKEIKATIQKKIYEQLLDKNISAESDFQEVLSKILQEHAKEIEAVENDIRKAEERFKEDKNKLMEQSDSEKEALKRVHAEEKKALESTVQNLLREVVKLKQQRKEIRMIHKKEKESMEEIYERDRIKLKEDWEQYKRDLLSKLQEDFDNKLAKETTKLERMLEDLKQQLEKSEKRKKELEDRLNGNAIDSEHVRLYEEAKVDKGEEVHSRELMSVKKTLEEEYDKKLKEEKRKFEETLQGLRREIGNLQEKRKLIQDKIYNQDPSLVDRNVIEKSIANYKMEMLSKMEEEVTQKVAREKKALEETTKEQQLEIDDLKRQRWELRNQIRRERSNLEGEFELERERMENRFLKEKEELKNKLESRLQREMTKRAMEDKVSRALSPISNVSMLT